MALMKIKWRVYFLQYALPLFLMGQGTIAGISPLVKIRSERWLERMIYCVGAFPRY
jgi:hypothetical protein